MREKDSIEVNLAINQDYPGFTDEETKKIIHMIQEQRNGNNNMTQIRNQMNMAGRQTTMNRRIDEYYTQYNLIRPDR